MDATARWGQMDQTAAPLTSHLVPPRREPPAKELPLFAFLRSLSNNALLGFTQRAFEEPVTHRRILGFTIYNLNDPEAIRHVLLENPSNYALTATARRIMRPIIGDGLIISEGSAWRHQRRTLAPAFTPRAINGLAPHIDRAVTEGIDAFRAEAAAGTVDLFASFHRLALEIAGRGMFSVGMDRHGPELRRISGEYGKQIGLPHLFDLLMPPGWPVPLDWTRARFRRRWNLLLDTIIAARATESKANRQGDLLDLLTATCHPDTGVTFTIEELRDQVATMMMAAHDTTTSTLFWASYLLALSPVWQERVAAEARATDLADPTGCHADGRLPLARAVVDEALRLYPAVYAITRQALGPDSVAGYSITRNDVVNVSPWSLHRHRRLWRDPDAFDPTRFLPGAPPPPRFAYLPFGTGPRVCIGAQFALTGAVLVLARLASAFRIELEDGEPVLPLAVVTVKPDRKARFRLTPR